MLPTCPKELPIGLRRLVTEFGKRWAKSSFRPRIDLNVLGHWDELLSEWADDINLPLYIRRSSRIRGSLDKHTSADRRIVYCDNSPAQWAFMMAFNGECPSLAEIKLKVDSDRIPVVMIQKTADRLKATYNCCLSREFNVNKRDWKLAHIHPVGLGTKKPISELPIELLKEHFKRLLSPSNMFVVPLAWGGIAEANEVTSAIIEADRLF